MTSNITFLKPTAADLESFAVREHEQGYGIDNLKWLVDNSVCQMFIMNGEPLAILGYTNKWEGVIEVYVLPSKNLSRLPGALSFRFVRHLQKILNNMLEDMPIHRMQTDSVADDATDKWMRVLGFTCEGTMPYYTPTKDTHRRWARYKE